MKKIYVPSYARYDKILKDTQTLAFISDEWLPHTSVVVRETEARQYVSALRHSPVGILTIPNAYIDKAERLRERPFLWADTMDFIVERAIDDQMTNILICDDDLTMSYRKSLFSGSPEPMTKHQWNEMTALLMDSDESVPLKSAMFRGFCINKKVEVRYNVSINGMFGFYVPVLKDRTDFRFCNTRALHMADRALVLRMLHSGYKNAEYPRYCYNDLTDTSGGCSLNRTQREHSQSAIELSREFPDSVELTVKTNLDDVRIGTKVYWNKAYKEKK